jgi:hypothetical protein
MKYMPLFVCEKCGCVENTALSMCSWGEMCERKPMLCSECCPKQGKWHGKFEKSKPKEGERYINRQETYVE